MWLLPDVHYWRIGASQLCYITHTSHAELVETGLVELLGHCVVFASHASHVAESKTGRKRPMRPRVLSWPSSLKQNDLLYIVSFLSNPSRWKYIGQGRTNFCQENSGVVTAVHYELS